MTIAYDVNNASLIIQDGVENADVRRNTLAEKVTLAYHRNPTEYHRNPKIMCCVLLTSSAMSMLWRNRRGTIIATVMFIYLDQNASSMFNKLLVRNICG